MQQQCHLFGSVSWINITWETQIEDNPDWVSPDYGMNAIKYSNYIAGANVLSGYLCAEWHYCVARWCHCTNVLVSFYEQLPSVCLVFHGICLLTVWKFGMKSIIGTIFVCQNTVTINFISCWTLNFVRKGDW